METIRKKVNLNDAIIRLSGCTVPYIGVSDDSLGKIYYDISGSTYVRTKTVARTYNKILNIIREGVKLNRKSNLSICSGTGIESKYVLTEEIESKYVLVEEFDINQITCEGIAYGIHSINSFDKINETEYETHIPLDVEDKKGSIVLIDVEDEDSAKEIKEKLLYCYRILFCGEKHGREEYVIPSLSVSYKLCNPYIEIPLALNQDIADLGHMTDYQDEFIDEIGEPIDLFPNLDGVSVDTKFRNNIPNPLSASTVEELTGFTTDSKLQFLRSKTIYTDDDGNLLPGVFSSISANTFYRFTYHPSSGTFNIAKQDSASAYTCSDGELVGPGEKKYRTATIAETAKALLKYNDSPEGSYYFLIKYKNDAATPMDIPFEQGKNGIISADTLSTPGFINIIYSANDITYKETYKYNPSVSAETTLDGFENITIYYNEIDYDFTKQTIYNKHYGVEREGNLADIISYNIADVWGKDGSMSEYTVNAPIFKEEYLLGISSTFKADVNVTINRGNAAAFERHFKLSECNTMEDLEAMGNGQFFNL